MSTDIEKVSTPHPEYSAHVTEWRLMRDVVAGAESVKRAGEIYLPKPDGFAFLESSDDERNREAGKGMWESYMKRAQFPDFVAPTIAEMVGMMHRVPAQVDLPPALEPLMERATVDGVPLASLHKRLTRELLTMGRAAVHPDVAPVLPGRMPEPRLSLYTAEAILNWSGEGTFYVLDESYQRRVGFEWELIERWRVIELDDDGIARFRIFEREPGGEIMEIDANGEPVGVWDGDGDGPLGDPIVRTGGDLLDAMPLVVVSASDVTDSVEPPPLAGMARAAIAAYRLDADYRHQLFWSGQETLAITGVDESSRSDLPSAFGAGIHITLPPDSDAKYIGPSGSGIAAHRQAIEDEIARAREIVASTYDTRTNRVESGEAKRIRLRERTVKLIDVALASGSALERALRVLARWIGADEDSVSVRPSLDFIDVSLEPEELRALLEAWQSGAISRETLYERLQEGEVATRTRTFEEEVQRIREEAPDLPSLFPGGSAAGDDGAAR